SSQYREALAKHSITQSMSGKGDPYDNAVAENYFSCLKCELVHHKHSRTRAEAQADIYSYIETYYNAVRPQSTLNWLSPLAYEHLLSVYAAKVA
ncbi:MAG: integrase core domain-containing protein, partial [Oscillospiraceae bacterium]|nr:integrase core domain-containing protein [Oscillospiraceae bacterium]